MLINLSFLLVIILVLGGIGFLFLDRLHRFKLELVEHLADKHDTIRDTLSVHSNDIAKRLVLIDDAQRKLTDLSNNVLTLQEILADKKSRGAFGEVQLQGLLHNLLPTKNYALQHQLSNGLRCDCMLFLPPPTGNVAIDAKFPLENYQKFNDPEISEIERKHYQQTFSQDIKKHINDIAAKYIVPGETANGAIMFIPAEAVFAEIHSRFPELVTLAQGKGVWLTSPTTLMAIITTASAVLKDNATREHIDCIQQHLRALAKDFTIFNERMVKLSKHIDAANADAKQVHISADKITRRFAAIEQVEIKEEE
jgi:DNA recombination protein RmuC